MYNYPYLTQALQPQPQQHVFLCSAVDPYQAQMCCPPEMMSAPAWWGNLRENWRKMPVLGKAAVITGGVLLGRYAINQVGAARANMQSAYYNPTWNANAYQMPSGGTLPGSTLPAANLTFSPAAYKAAADALETAMNTSGTDEDGIVAIMKKIQNISDVKALNDAFGERTNYVFGIPAYTAGLGYWLNDELGAGSSYMNQINSDLASKGIAYSY